jgi:solute:Na+ symporter, SSS family
LVLPVFYAPWLGTNGGAPVSIVGSMVATIACFLMRNPFGIDNAYCL